MCEASVDMITSVWMESQQRPYPDMSLNKQCRDFEAVLRWNEQEEIRGMDEKMEGLRMPEGVVPVELTPSLRKLVEAGEAEEEGG